VFKNATVITGMFYETIADVWAKGKVYYYYLRYMKRVKKASINMILKSMNKTVNKHTKSTITIEHATQFKRLMTEAHEKFISLLGRDQVLYLLSKLKSAQEEKKKSVSISIHSIFL